MNKTDHIRNPASLRQRDKGLYHSRFGDLSDPASVTMEQKYSEAFPFANRPVPYIHLSITGRCYARCMGCVNAAITASYPGKRSDIVPIEDTRPDRDAACIAHLIRAQGQGPVVVCFYGGEPLLETEKIAEVCSLLKEAGLPNAISYMLYTNGDLLHKAVQSHPALMRDIWLYAVSIDGCKEQHNRIRLGTNIDRIHQGLASLKTIRTGKVLMWSTLREDQLLLNCFEEFLELHEKGFADQFFWHWVETSEPFNQLEAYAKRYGSDLVAIMDTYTDWLEKGNILPIVHINELVVYLLSGYKRNSSACGVELAKNFDLIDGKIHSCADLPPELAIGTIDDSGLPLIDDHDLSFLIRYKNDLGCYTCKVHDYCGGRCPVQAYSGGTERLGQYCQLMRLHIGCVKEYLARIIAAMDKHAIRLQDLYDTSAFYAQFTDATP